MSQKKLQNRLQHKFAKVPDFLTLSRIVTTPVIAILALTPILSLQYIALALFFLACITDMLDGYIARKFNLTSRLGGLFDSYADKVIIIIMMFLLVVLHRLDTHYALVPAFIITCRELLIFIIRFYFYLRKQVLEVSYLSKSKTILQMLGVLLLLYPAQTETITEIGIYCLWTAAALSIITGLQYCFSMIKLHSDRSLLKKN